MVKYVYRTAIVVVLMNMLLVLPSVLLASEATDSIRSTMEEAFTVLKDKKLASQDNLLERREMLRQIFRKSFDFKEMAKRSLARHWNKRSEEERAEFVRLFNKLLETAYIGKIESYTGEEIIYTDEKMYNSGKALVKTNIILKSGTEVPVNYRMLKENNKWMVYDIVIEGVSLVGNYRSQFNKIIRRSSYSDLLAMLKKKLGVRESLTSD